VDARDLSERRLSCHVRVSVSAVSTLNRLHHAQDAHSTSRRSCSGYSSCCR